MPTMNKDTQLKVIDEMQPLKDYLQGKSSTIGFIEKCREIIATENAEFEILEPKQLTSMKKDIILGDADGR